MEALAKRDEARCPEQSSSTTQKKRNPGQGSPQTARARCGRPHTSTGPTPVPAPTATSADARHPTRHTPRNPMQGRDVLAHLRAVALIGRSIERQTLSARVNQYSQSSKTEERLTWPLAPTRTHGGGRWPPQSFRWGNSHVTHTRQSRLAHVAAVSWPPSHTRYRPDTYPIQTRYRPDTDPIRT